MRSAYRISPRLVAALVIAGVILIGWVARKHAGSRGNPRRVHRLCLGVHADTLDRADSRPL